MISRRYTMLRLKYERLKLVTILLLTLLFLMVVSKAFGFDGAVVQGRVMQVKDGDTVVIAPTDGGQFFVCRLYGIDAPEIAKRNKAGQPYGEDAMKELKSIVLGQTVTVELTGSKTYNREVCIIKKDGMNVNLEIVRRGYAWAYKQYLKRPHASEYIDAENEARGKRLGLWQQSNPIPPWEFRHRR